MRASPGDSWQPSGSARSASPAPPSIPKPQAAEGRSGLGTLSSSRTQKHLAICAEDEDLASCPGSRALPTPRSLDHSRNNLEAQEGSVG